jgi:hypothetical protein
MLSIFLQSFGTIIQFQVTKKTESVAVKGENNTFYLEVRSFVAPKYNALDNKVLHKY